MEEIIRGLTGSMRSSRQAKAKLHDHQRNLEKRNETFKALEGNGIKNVHSFVNQTGTNIVTLNSLWHTRHTHCITFEHALTKGITVQSLLVTALS